MVVLWLGIVTMAPGDRALVGLMGAALTVFLVQGLQYGVMYGEFQDHDAGEQPFRFALAVLGNILGIGFCAIYAAGYDVQDVWHLARWLAMERT